MAAEHGGSAISHHLQHWTVPFMGGHLNMDSLISSWVVCAILVGVGLLVRKGLVTDGAPSRLQNLVEMLVEFINNTVRDNFPGKNPHIAPLALTIFAFVLLCNTIDILPVYLGIKTPTADINLPVAMALVVFSMTLYYSIKVKGLGYFKTYLFHPFGKFLMPVNIVMTAIEELAKPLSLSFRLFGNMFAGEVIFLLFASLIPWWMHFVPGVLWSGFHLFVGLIQAFIFMILTVVYLSMAHQVDEH
ncbi:MAG: ATP synthase F0 subunit A [Alphaproteobacteria bacterium CG_4_10_14_0_2_um_filter_63_37]|nr:MAG: ATP synthase F0 subunit A [Proteobacteria bacterium CG1_02_64_396]PJA25910.1 MAG: ATP synthase F0 subunit A [Alphaproteobacteria bacterium CG_4_10_14_0_2_um_filter_63_37]